MRLAIYEPVGAFFIMILAPDCIHPSLSCEHRFGELRRIGTVTLSEIILQAIGQDVSSTTGSIEYVVTSETAVRAVEALMDREEYPHARGKLAALTPW